MRAPGAPRMEGGHQVYDRPISFIEGCAFLPIRREKANGWSTETIEIHRVADVEAVRRRLLEEFLWSARPQRRNLGHPGYPPSNRAMRGLPTRYTA